MNFLEKLREEMIAAFHKWAKTDSSRRDPLWDEYTSARERFLAARMGEKYRPIHIPPDSFH